MSDIERLSNRLAARHHGGMDLSEVASAGLGVRWLGRVDYRDAVALQRQLRDHSTKDHLLLLEHDHVVTLSRRTPRDHLLVDVEALGAAVVDTDRGGDITYHGPGQLWATRFSLCPGSGVAVWPTRPPTSTGSNRC